MNKTESIITVVVLLVVGLLLGAVIAALAIVSYMDHVTPKAPQTGYANGTLDISKSSSLLQGNQIDYQPAVSGQVVQPAGRNQ